jgi:uncharacterized membrane protein YkoI
MWGVALLATCLCASAPSPATDNAGTARTEHELTPSQATALVQQRYAARVVRASSTDEGGRHIYVFRLLSQAGKVWEVHIDARSGAEVR